MWFIKHRATIFLNTDTSVRQANVGNTVEIKYLQFFCRTPLVKTAMSLVGNC